MAVLYYHRMVEGFPESLYRSVSHAAGYSKRSFVLTTPDRNDCVLIDPSRGMDLSFPELALLNRQGLGPRPENVFIAHFDHQRSWQENVAHNRQVLRRLQNSDIDILYPFTGKSTIVHLLADHLGVPVRTSSRESAYWCEDKKTLLAFRDLAPIPFGYEVLTNKELVAKWRTLSRSGSYPGTAVIKASQTASGVVSSIIKDEEHLRMFMGTFDLEELDGGVLMEWYDSDRRSPSINYFIYPDGTFKVLFVSDQIFEDSTPAYGHEGTRIHRGNRFPSTFTGDIQQRIIRCTRPLVEALCAHGYWGPVGFDTIVAHDDEIFITEINPRITGPHFGWRPMKNLGLPCFCLQNEKIAESIDFGRLKDILSGVLYAPGQEAGYILFNFFPGKFIGLIVSSDEQAADELRSRVAEILSPVRPSRH